MKSLKAVCSLASVVCFAFVTLRPCAAAKSALNPEQVALLRWYPANVTTTLSGLNSPVGVVFDGESIWVVNQLGNSVTKLRASDGTSLGTFSVGSEPEFVAFDGANIWVATTGAATVTKLSASTGANLGTFAVGSGPGAVVFDGSNIWVGNFSSNSVTKLRASDGSTLGTFAV